jgi:NADPH:quinone reductase-like Zn-dependent oxidoreductase
MTENIALWLMSKRGSFSVGPAPVEGPDKGEILIQVKAIAVNPFERMIQTVGDLITSWIAYPAILGTDVSGEVVAIGAGVSRFRVGDRVVGFAAGTEKGHRSAEGAFQTHVILAERVTAPIPEGLSFVAASVLPLGIATAAAGLFQRDFLSMRPPSELPALANETLVVWGGSTSVGCNAIQLAVAAGYDVIATSSLHNSDYLRELGARMVFDRRDPKTVFAIIEALRGRKVCGAIAVGPGSAHACLSILAASEGNRFIAMATPPVSFDDVPAGRGRWRKLLPVLAGIVAGNIALTLKARFAGVRAKFIWGGAPVANEIGPMIFNQFLPAALRDGRYQAAPHADVIGKNLEAIPLALERQRRGVSATKLVIQL